MWRAFAAGLLLCVSFAANANDLGNSSWSEIDASNDHASPNGWKSGVMTPNQVEPTARAMAGAIKRWYNHIQPSLTSSGAANVQTLTYAQAPAAYVTGDVYKFIAGYTNTGAATLDINGLGAKAIQLNGNALAGGELQAGKVSEVSYDGTAFQLNSLRPGTAIGTYPQIINFDGADLQGFYAPNGWRFRKVDPTATDAANFLFLRDAAFIGGGPGVNNALGVNCSAAAGITSYEWCNSIIMTNSGTAADGSQNVAHAWKMEKLSTGASWGGLYQFQDFGGADPLASSVGFEQDFGANGTDVHLSRVMQDLIFVKLDSGGDNPTISFGIRFATDALTTLTQAMTFSHGNYGTLIGTYLSPSMNHGVDLSGGTCIFDCFKSTGFSVSPSGAIAETGKFSVDNSASVGGAASATQNSLEVIAGALGTALNNDINLGGFRADTGNTSLMSAHIRRTVDTGTDWTTTAFGITYDIDSTVGFGGSLWFNNGVVDIGDPIDGPGLKNSAGIMQITNATGSAFAKVQGKLMTDTNFTGGAPTAAGYLTIYDGAGNAYKIPACLASGC